MIFWEFAQHSTLDYFCFSGRSLKQDEGLRQVSKMFTFLSGAISSVFLFLLFICLTFFSLWLRYRCSLSSDLYGQRWQNFITFPSLSASSFHCLCIQCLENAKMCQFDITGIHSSVKWFYCYALWTALNQTCYCIAAMRATTQHPSTKSFCISFFPFICFFFQTHDVKLCSLSSLISQCYDLIICPKLLL